MAFFAICKHSSKTWFKWKLPILYINITIKLNRSTVHLGVQLKKGVHSTSAIEMTQRKEKDYLVPHVTVYSSFHSSLSVEDKSMPISLRYLPNTFSPHTWISFFCFFKEKKEWWPRRTEKQTTDVVIYNSWVMRNIADFKLIAF